MTEAYVVLDTQSGALLAAYGSKMPAIYPSAHMALRIKKQRLGKSERHIVCRARIQIIGGEVDA